MNTLVQEPISGGSAILQALKMAKPSKIVCLDKDDGEPLMEPDNLRRNAQFAISLKRNGSEDISDYYVCPTDTDEQLVLWRRPRPHNLAHFDPMDYSAIASDRYSRSHSIAYCSHGHTPLACAAFWMLASYGAHIKPVYHFEPSYHLHHYTFLQGGLLTCEDFALAHYVYRKRNPMRRLECASGNHEAKANVDAFSVIYSSVVTSADALRLHMRRIIYNEFRTMQAFADQGRVSLQYVSNVLKGAKPVPTWMLEQLRIAHIVDERWIIPVDYPEPSRIGQPTRPVNMMSSIES